MHMSPFLRPFLLKKKEISSYPIFFLIFLASLRLTKSDIRLGLLIVTKANKGFPSHHPCGHFSLITVDASKSVAVTIKSPHKTLSRLLSVTVDSKVVLKSYWATKQILVYVFCLITKTSFKNMIRHQYWIVLFLSYHWMLPLVFVPALLSTFFSSQWKFMKMFFFLLGRLW